MILRRNNLRNKSPRSKSSLKSIHAATKKYCSETKHSNKQRKSIGSTEQDDLLLKTSIFYDSEDSRYELFGMHRRSKKDLPSQKARRSRRGSSKVILSDVEDNSSIGNTEKESAKSCTKKTEENIFSKKNSRCKDIESNKTLNTVKKQGTREENVKQKRQTVPKNNKVKKTVVRDTSTPLSVAVRSKSLPQPFRYHLNSIPVDDLTASSHSTPPSVERLFTSRLAKGSRVSSIPHLIKKSESPRFNIAKRLLPGKGSLKRKRWVISSLKGRNEGYEDDLFENCEIKPPLLLEDSDLSDVSIATPKCAYLISPSHPQKTPHFKDCYSPSELFRARKVAEEYMHRRNKKRRNCSDVEETTSAGKKSIPLTNDIDASSEAKRQELMELVFSLNKKQNSVELNEDSEEDYYYNDVSF